MNIAAKTDYLQYKSFNHFFTREIKPSSRPVTAEENTLACPVDGTISQIGVIHDMEIFQAKGHSFDLSALLAGNHELIKRFCNGMFTTLYLSPKDYHRIHMPLDGQLDKMIYVPGRLFSVNRTSTHHINNLFARNERIISVFDCYAGKLAVITVGALFVGSMETSWAGQLTPAAQRKITCQEYSQNDQKIKLNKGEEMGRFNMGSTVILLFQTNRIKWSPELTADCSVIMGQAIGEIIH